MQREEHFDLKMLKRCNLKIDRLIDYTCHKYQAILARFRKPNAAFGDFNNVTIELVQEFKDEAKEHVRHILRNKSEYGYLYNLIGQKELFNTVVFEHGNFSLLSPQCELVIKRVESIAETIHAREKAEFPATCLYILYFFARLVNPAKNWITIDYLTNGNVFHKYFMQDGLNWNADDCKCKI